MKTLNKVLSTCFYIIFMHLMIILNVTAFAESTIDIQRLPQKEIQQLPQNALDFLPSSSGLSNKTSLSEATNQSIPFLSI